MALSEGERKARKSICTAVAQITETLAAVQAGRFNSPGLPTADSASCDPALGAGLSHERTDIPLSPTAELLTAAVSASPLVHPRVAENVEVVLKYKGYLERQVRTTVRASRGARIVAPGECTPLRIDRLGKSKPSGARPRRPRCCQLASATRVFLPFLRRSKRS